MITEFAEKSGVPAELILGRSRVQAAVDARHLYWKLLRDKRGFSYPTLGKLNDRTAATVLHGVRKANDMINIGDRRITEVWEKVKGIEF